MSKEQTRCRQERSFVRGPFVSLGPTSPRPLVLFKGRGPSACRERGVRQRTLDRRLGERCDRRAEVAADGLDVDARVRERCEQLGPSFRHPLDDKRVPLQVAVVRRNQGLAELSPGRCFEHALLRGEESTKELVAKLNPRRIREQQLATHDRIDDLGAHAET